MGFPFPPGSHFALALAFSLLGQILSAFTWERKISPSRAVSPIFRKIID